MRWLGRLLRNYRAGKARLFYKHITAPQSIVLTSPGFVDGVTMPRQYLGRTLGADLSPPLIWSGLPAATKSLALVIEDYDVPLPISVVHGLAYWKNGPIAALPEGALSQPALPGLLVGKNALGKSKYAGPMPLPGHGPHHYAFQILALDAELVLAAGYSRKMLARAVTGHVLAYGLLTGISER